MIPVPEYVRSVSVGVQPHTGAGVRLLPSPLARPCESLSHSRPRLGDAWGGDCGALDHQGRWRVDRRGQGERALSLLVVGSAPLDLTLRGWLQGRGAPGLFLPPHVRSPGKEKEVAPWPGDAQHKGAVGTRRAAGETEQGSGGKDWMHRNPTWLREPLRWKPFCNIWHFVGFPSTSTAHTVLHQTATRPVTSMVNFTSNTLAHLDYGQSSDI